MIYEKKAVRSYPLEVQAFLCPVGECESPKLEKETNTHELICLLIPFLGEIQQFMITNDKIDKKLDC